MKNLLKLSSSTINLDTMASRRVINHRSSFTHEKCNKLTSVDNVCLHCFILPINIALKTILLCITPTTIRKHSHGVRERAMKLKGSILIKLFIVQYLSVLCLAQDFDFFYFVQQVGDSVCYFNYCWKNRVLNMVFRQL